MYMYVYNNYIYNIYLHIWMREKKTGGKKMVSRGNSPIIDRISKTLGANPIFHHQIWRANYFPRHPLRPYNPHSPLRDPQK